MVFLPEKKDVFTGKKSYSFLTGNW